MWQCDRTGNAVTSKTHRPGRIGLQTKTGKDTKTYDSVIVTRTSAVRKNGTWYCLGVQVTFLFQDGQRHFPKEDTDRLKPEG